MTHDKVTCSQLQKMNFIHRLELKKIERMSERQFQAFKTNFSVGSLKNITRDEACSLLKSMLTLNLQLIDDLSESNESKKRPG